MNASPIGFRRVNHVSWAVTELDLAVELYVMLLGAEVVYEVRRADVKEIRINLIDRDYWASIHNNANLECRSISMLQLSDGFRIELCHVESVLKENVVLFQRRGGRNCLSLEVESIDRATKYLLTLGFRVFEVTRTLDCSLSYSYHQHFLDPWGNSFKLLGPSWRAGSSKEKEVQ